MKPLHQMLVFYIWFCLQSSLLLSLTSVCFSKWGWCPLIICLWSFFFFLSRYLSCSFPSLVISYAFSLSKRGFKCTSSCVSSCLSWIGYLWDSETPPAELEEKMWWHCLGCNPSSTTYVALWPWKSYFYPGFLTFHFYLFTYF